MVTPGKRNGAQHVHNYVGNLSTDANSDDDSLHAAGTAATATTSPPSSGRSCVTPAKRATTR